MVAPLIEILIPGKGLPSEEVRVPEMVRSCANTCTTHSKTNVSVKITRIGIWFCYHWMPSRLEFHKRKYNFFLPVNGTVKTRQFSRFLISKLFYIHLRN